MTAGKDSHLDREPSARLPASCTTVHWTSGQPIAAWSTLDELLSAMAANVGFDARSGAPEPSGKGRNHR